MARRVRKCTLPFERCYPVSANNISSPRVFVFFLLHKRYIPFRVEYFNNNDMTTYSDFAPLRLTEFQLPADTDVNATNPPDRQVTPLVYK